MSFSQFTSHCFILFLLFPSLPATPPLSHHAAATALRWDDLDHLALEGVVTDPSGALIAGARVTARSVTGGYSRSTTTNAEGRYRLVRLQPGIYQVCAEASGFRAFIVEGIQGNAGTTLRRDFQLTPNVIEAGVTIEAAREPDRVDTSRTVIGSILGRSAIDQLPTFDRNIYELLLSVPGVAEPALSTNALADGDDIRFRSAPEETGIFSLNGGTPYSNNLTIEGLDNNDDRAARERFVPTIDAVEEVQVITNQFSAEYGRASGGRVNLRLRSGGDSYHGRIFHHLRDARLNANSYQRNADPTRGFRLPFTEHNTGATFGGPVLRERLSFFGAYEYSHVSDHAEIAALVPARPNPAFELPLPNGANLGSTSTDRQGKPVVMNGGAAVGLYDLALATPKRATTMQSRLDAKLSERQTAFLMLTLFEVKDERGFPGGRRTLDTMRTSGRNSSSIAASHSLVLSDKALAETRLQYSRLTPLDGPASYRPVILIEIDDPRDVQGVANPLSRRGNLLAGSSNISGTDRHESRFQLQESLTVMMNRHQLRAGVDVQMIRSRFIDLEDTTGTFTFASVADFLADRPARFRQRFNTSSSLSNLYAGGFLQDEWRPIQNLTLSAGVRWDNETALRDVNNVGPRLAVSWDPLARGTMVLRAGFGMFYNRVLLRTLDDFRLTSSSMLIDTNLPQAEPLLLQLHFPKPLSVDDPRINQMGLREDGFVRRLESKLRVPESYQSAIGFESTIPRLGRIEINYVYNRGAHLWREINANAARLPAGYSTFTGYLTSHDFANQLDAATGLRPISSTGNADLVRFDLSSTSSRVINEAGKRIAVFGLNTQSTSNSTSALRAALAAVRSLRADPALEQVEELHARGNSYYHGVTLSVERSGSFGRFLGAYTLGRLIDDGVVNTSSPLVVGDFRREVARSLLDARHRFVLAANVRVPILPGRFNLGITLNVTSPRPFSIGINGNDRNLDDVSNDRPNYDGTAQDIGWVTPNAAPDGRTSPGSPVFERFSLPTIGSVGNLGRNAGRGPWQHTLSARLSTVFKLTERIQVTPLIESFNPLNTTVFSFGSEFVDYTPTGAGDFLVPARTLRPRTMRLGLRLEF